MAQKLAQSRTKPWPKSELAKVGRARDDARIILDLHEAFRLCRRLSKFHKSSNRVVDVPIMMQRQVPAIQKIQKTVKVPQMQFIDKVDVPVVMQRQVPTIQKVQKTVEVVEVQFIDRIIDVPPVH